MTDLIKETLDFSTQGLLLLKKLNRTVTTINDLNEIELIEMQKWYAEKELATYKQLKEGK